MKKLVLQVALTVTDETDLDKLSQEVAASCCDGLARLENTRGIEDIAINSFVDANDDAEMKAQLALGEEAQSTQLIN